MTRIISPRPPVPFPHPVLVSGTGTRTPAGGSFTPLQHFSFDTFTTGAAAAFGQELYSTIDTNGSNTGSIIQTTVHRTTKSKAAQLRIAAGTSGFPADGETPAANGFWGFSLAPPSSAGSNKYGAQGYYHHLGMWMYIPSASNLATTSLTDGALKFLLNCFPQAVTTAKDDIHICGTSGFAFVKELDNTATFSFPSTRSGTETSYPVDAWFWLERLSYLHSSGAEGITRLWINNVLIMESVGTAHKWRHADGSYGSLTLNGQGNKTLPNSTTQMESIFIFSYWNAHPAANQTLYMDDITTWTGVNNSTLPAVDAFGNRMIGSAQF